MARGTKPRTVVWRLRPIPAMPPAASFSLKLLAVTIQRKVLGGGTDSSVPLLKRPSQLGRQPPLESAPPPPGRVLRPAVTALISPFREPVVARHGRA